MSEEVKSRKCNACGIEKPVSELVASKKYFGGYMPLCKPCRNIYWVKKRAGSPEERRRAVDRVRKSRILSKHGVSHEGYQQMVQKCGDRCQLCGSTESGRNKEKFRVWNIDHCHATGRVRGLLCHNCNIGLGHLENFVAKIGREKIESYLTCSLPDVGVAVNGAHAPGNPPRGTVSNSAP